MKHNIRMIAMDLDGTLLTTEKELTDRTKQALEACIRRGIVVLAATGRPLCGLPQNVMDVEGMRYAVVSNGARVVDLCQKKTVEEHLLPGETAGKLLTIFEKYDTLREIYYDGFGYAQSDALERLDMFQDSEAMRHYVLTTRKGVPDIREMFEQENRDLDKIQAVFTSVEDRDRALEEVKEIPGIEISMSLKKNIEVNGENINKGNALAELGKHLGISMEEVMAFGDSSNDTAMITMSGVGVAMANSTEEVLTVADYVTASNDEEGVADFIETYILEEREGEKKC